MIHTECCISRCDGVFNKDRENPSHNTGNINKSKPTATSTCIKDFKFEIDKPRHNTGKYKLGNREYHS